MIVKKVDSEWTPKEKPDIKVGETIEITDPKALILSGKVKAITKDGVEISAYDLYGVITRDERKEFEEYSKQKKTADEKVASLKKVEEEKKKLEKEAEALMAKIKADKMKTAEVVKDKLV